MIFEQPSKPTAPPGATPNRDRPRQPVTIEAAAGPESDPRPASEPKAAGEQAPWFRPEPESGPETASAPPPPPAKRRSLAPWLVAGALLIAAGAFAWPYLMNRTDSAAAERTATLERRLAALESRPMPNLDVALAPLSQQVDALEKRPLPSPAPPSSIPAPDALAAMERRIAAAEAAAASALSQAEAAKGAADAAKTAADSAAKNIATAAAPPTPPAAPAPPPVNLGPLNERLAALDGRVGALEKALSAAKSTERVTEARIEAGGANIERATMAVVAQALTQAIERGAPFTDEVAALKALGVDATRVVPLEGAAAKGLPTVPQLRAQFAAIAAKLAEQPEPAAEGGMLDRLVAGAARLIRIERVGEPGAPKPGTAGEVDAALARGDIAAAIEAWKRLPQPAQAASANWRAAAQARLDALAAARTLAAESIKSLGAGKP